MIAVASSMGPGRRNPDGEGGEDSPEARNSEGKQNVMTEGPTMTEYEENI
jgi:hypothetical protein